MLVLTGAQANVPSAAGTLLCDLNVSPFFFVGTPGQTFQLRHPADCGLVGATACFQGASVEISGLLTATNAIDVQIGS